MRERAFFLLKPDGVPREAEIRAILDRHVRVVAERRFARAPMKRIAALYAEHRGKEFYPWLLAIFRGKPVKAYILESKKAGGKTGDFHTLLEKLVGATDPKKAAPGTIRALSGDDMTVSMRQKRSVRNLVHRSRAPEESLREGALFFFDLAGPGEEEIDVEPFAREFLDPLGKAGGAGIAGHFFGQRLTHLLRRMRIIPAGARVTSYRETVPSGRSRRHPVLLVMRIGCRVAGKTGEILIEILEE